MPEMTVPLFTIFGTFDVKGVKGLQDSTRLRSHRHFTQMLRIGTWLAAP